MSKFCKSEQEADQIKEKEKKKDRVNIKKESDKKIEGRIKH